MMCEICMYVCDVRMPIVFVIIPTTLVWVVFSTAIPSLSRMPKSKALPNLGVAWEFVYMCDIMAVWSETEKSETKKSWLDFYRFVLHRGRFIYLWGVVCQRAGSCPSEAIRLRGWLAWLGLPASWISRPWFSTRDNGERVTCDMYLKLQQERITV